MGVLVLGVGNPLLDISSKVPMDVLDKYEVKSGDIILAEDKHAGIYDELVEKYAPEYIAGGATQNSIRVCAWMLKAASRTGACAFAGCVGSDANGKKLQECAEAGGVEVAYQVDGETPTGVCAVLVDPSNERTLVTRLDAANNFKKDHLESPAVQKLIVSAKVIYSAGFFLTSGGPECTELLGAHCAEYGKRFCLNISAPFIAQFFGAQLDATLPHVDILFANETEAAALGEAKGWGSDVAAVALKVAALPKASGLFARAVVFTQGADATLVAYGGVVHKYNVPKLDKAKIVDTNGAGGRMLAFGWWWFAILLAAPASAGLTLRSYENSGFVSTPNEVVLPDTSRIALHPNALSGIASGMLALPAGTWNFSCAFESATLGFVWVDGHLVCQTGAYDLAPGSGDDPLPVRRNASVAFRAHLYGANAHRNMLTMTKLPAGVALTTALCRLSTGACVDVAVPDGISRCGARVRPGPYAIDRSYGEYSFGMNATLSNVSVAFSVGDGGETLRATYAAVGCGAWDCSDFALRVSGRFLWAREGSVAVGNASVTFAPAGLARIDVAASRAFLAPDALPPALRGAGAFLPSTPAS
ncbi:adenosine kinase [Aureococcus anophagefferens]|nr:adenosine kinase [Aureococcus anophagefferens]